MVNTVKFNITYFTDNDEDEPLETVFSYLDMPPHIAKKYAKIGRASCRERV